MSQIQNYCSFSNLWIFFFAALPLSNLILHLWKIKHCIMVERGSITWTAQKTHPNSREKLLLTATVPLQAPAIAFAALNYCPTAKYLLCENSCSWPYHGNSSRCKHLKNALHHSAPLEPLPWAAAGCAAGDRSAKHLHVISQHSSVVCLVLSSLPWGNLRWVGSQVREHTSPCPCWNSSPRRMPSWCG